MTRLLIADDEPAPLEQLAEALATAWPEEWFEYSKVTPIARVGIRLHKDGTYQADPYKDPRDFRKFQAAVTVAQEQLARRKKGVGA